LHTAKINSEQHAIIEKKTWGEGRGTPRTEASKTEMGGGDEKPIRSMNVSGGQHLQVAGKRGKETWGGNSNARKEKVYKRNRRKFGGGQRLRARNGA